MLRKVYVRFGQSCPFRFRTCANPPPGTVLRAMPIYIRPQNVQEVVKRCPYHAVKTAPDNVGVIAPADHLVRCDHKLSRYEQDKHTGFHSVVAPYEHPIGMIQCYVPHLVAPYAHPIAVLSPYELQFVCF